MIRAVRQRGIARPLRYLVVGAACAALNNLLLICTVAAGFGSMVAALLICLPMLIIGYGLHVIVTFQARASWTGFLRYGAGILASYPLWLGGLFVLHDVMMLPIATAGLIATALVFLWNYVATHLAFRARLMEWRSQGRMS